MTQNKTDHLGIRLLHGQRAKMDEACAKLGINMTEFVIRAINEKLNRLGVR